MVKTLTNRKFSTLGQNRGIKFLNGHATLAKDRTFSVSKNWLCLNTTESLRNDFEIQYTRFLNVIIAKSKETFFRNGTGRRRGFEILNGRLVSGHTGLSFERWVSRNWALKDRNLWVEKNAVFDMNFDSTILTHKWWDLMDLQIFLTLYSSFALNAKGILKKITLTLKMALKKLLATHT